MLRDEDDYLEQTAAGLACYDMEMPPQHSLKILSLLSWIFLLSWEACHQNGDSDVKKDLRRISWDHVEAIRRLAESEKPQAALISRGIDSRADLRSTDLLCFH